MKKKEREPGISVQLRMDKKLVERLDKYRDPRFRSRSSVIQEALLKFLDQEEK